MKPLSQSPPQDPQDNELHQARQRPTHSATCVAMRVRDNCSIRMHASRATGQPETILTQRSVCQSVSQPAKKKVDSYLAPACQSGPKGTQTTIKSRPARSSLI